MEGWLIMVLRRSFQLQNSRRKAESKVTCDGINGFSRSRPSSVPEGVITSSLLCLQNWNVTELIGYHNGSGLQRLNMSPTAVHIPTLPPVASVPIPSRASLLQPLSLYILQTSSN
ncbi:hypothetical protein H0E87_007936 [Populus deltoides]|uniref:Uncharacterized protein n=1 Tax=Populus deltoides TaxID=3696 RepID=A0A8T2YY58_POPDE|nr:hypothetical protein H0E87_007936 [Populus deltoides]